MSDPLPIEPNAAILNAIPAHIALLDREGCIVAVNDAWRQFAAANGFPAAFNGVGANYLRACEPATPEFPPGAAETAQGLRQVLSGEAGVFSTEYPCHSPTEFRWFRLMATPLRVGDGPGAMVMHIDISERRRAEETLRQTEQEQRRLAEQLAEERSRLVAAQAVAKVGSWETNLADLAISWSAETHRIFETDPHAFVPTHPGFLARVHPDDRALVDHAFRSSVEARRAQTLEHRLLMPDGRVKFVEERWEIIGDAQGRAVRARGTCQDLTARRQAEQRAAAAQRFNLTLIESSPLAIVAYRASGEGVIANTACMRLLGAPSVDAVRRQNFRQIESWQRTGLLAAATLALSTGRSQEREIRTQNSFGREIWLHCRLIPVHYEDEQYLLGFFDDIRERKQAEAERDRLFNLSLDLLCVAGFDGRLQQVNPAWTECLGWSAAELTSRPMIDFIHPDDQEATRLSRIAIQAGQPSRGFENRYRCKDGTYRWLSWSVHPLTDSQQVFAVARDVTARRASQAELLASEERYRLLFSHNPHPMWLFDTESLRILAVNAAAVTHYGYTEAEFLTMRVIDLRAPEDEVAFADALAWLPATGKTSGLRRHRKKDGTVIQVEATSDTVMLAGQPARLTLAHDVTERVMAERTLREQAALLDNAHDAIIVRDPAHHITYWNRAAERIYGWTAAEARGRQMHQLLQIDPARFAEATEAILRTGAWNGEIEKTAKNGTVLTVEGSWTLLRDSAGTPLSILTIDTDITERKKLEQQFLRAQRMESIGTLAGGIAHDLNNLLVPITMGVELLREFQPSARSVPIIDNMERSARRGAELVKQVLSFARGVEGSRVAVHVRHVLQEIESIAHNTFPKNIVIDMHVATDLGPVLADPTQLNQVVLNLCVNARDAMPGGGRLLLAAENVAVDEATAALHRGVSPGRYVAIDITDSGCGIPQEIIDRIFEPFFTTKELGQGTGLGLSTVIGIVRSHGGFVTVGSVVGQGSTFRVYLPLLADPAGAAGGVLAVESVPRGNGELILVVDDEVPILEITKQTLRTFGYQVVTAEGGAQAVAVYASRPAEIALVLTDLMMPSMDGVALIGALQRINPAVRIIVASGLSVQSNVARAANAGVKHFLAKPHRADTLLTTVRRALTESGGSRPPMG